jgi:hypothetical protein
MMTGGKKAGFQAQLARLRVLSESGFPDKDLQDFAFSPNGKLWR